MNKTSIVKRWHDFANDDLRLLRRMCGEIADSFDDIEEACIHLTAYGVQSRYPMEIELTELICIRQ